LSWSVEYDAQRFILGAPVLLASESECRITMSQDRRFHTQSTCPNNATCSSSILPPSLPRSSISLRLSTTATSLLHRCIPISLSLSTTATSLRLNTTSSRFLPRHTPISVRPLGSVEDSILRRTCARPSQTLARFPISP